MRLDFRDLEFTGPNRLKLDRVGGYTFDNLQFIVTAPQTDIRVGNITVSRARRDSRGKEDEWYFTHQNGERVAIPYSFGIRRNHKFRKQGIGTYMLLQANHWAQNKYGIPLHSSNEMNSHSEHLWERMVGKGFAEEYSCMGDTRWRFLPKQ